MNVKLTLFAFSAAAVLLCGCGKNGEDKTPELVFSGDSAALLSSGISAGAEGGDYAISFTSATDWHIDLSEGTRALASWVAVTPPAGKGGSVDAIITVQANETLESRSATLAFVSGEVRKSMSISQAARGSIAITGVTLNEHDASLFIGETLLLVASVTPSNTDEDKTVSWTSSDSAVATVEDGLVTAVGEGSADITASAGSVSAVCHITVPHKVIEVEEVSLDITETTLQEGEKLQLIVTVTPSDADAAQPQWESSDASVASVDNNGFVTAVSPGTAVITVTAGGKSASCTITVVTNYVAVESVSLDNGLVELKRGETLQLIATIYPSNATEQMLQWYSTDSSVASVDENGLVTAEGKGSAVIVVTAIGGASAECTVNVVANGNGGENLDDTVNVNPW